MSGNPNGFCEIWIRSGKASLVEGLVTHREEMKLIQDFARCSALTCTGTPGVIYLNQKWQGTSNQFDLDAQVLSKSTQEEMQAYMCNVSQW